jgi:hypothetical protein
MPPAAPVDLDQILTQAEAVFVVYFASFGIVFLFVLIGEAILRWRRRSPVEKLLRQRRFG